MKPTLEQRLRRIEEKISQKRRVTESGKFYRLSKREIGDRLYVLQKEVKSFYEGQVYGNDLDMERLDRIISNFEKLKNNAKVFFSKDEVEGTDFE